AFVPGWMGRTWSDRTARACRQQSARMEDSWHSHREPTFPVAHGQRARRSRLTILTMPTFMFVTRRRALRGASVAVMLVALLMAQATTRRSAVMAATWHSSPRHRTRPQLRRDARLKSISTTL